MAALAFSASVWSGLPQRDKTILRYLSAVLTLGNHVRYERPDTSEWFVFDDWRFKMVHVAYLGCVISNRDDIPPGYTIPQLPDGGGDDLAQMRSDIMAFCQSGSRVNPLVLPSTLDFTDDPNPWQTTLDAQNAPQAAILMAGEVPDTWTPVQTGP